MTKKSHPNNDLSAIYLNTKPENLELKSKETALIVVDMQNAYASKKESLFAFLIY